MIEAKLVYKDKRLKNDPMLFSCLDFYGDSDVVLKLIELKELHERTPYIEGAAEIDCIKVEKRKNLEKMASLEKQLSQKEDGVQSFNDYKDAKLLEEDIRMCKYMDVKLTFDIDMQKKLSFASSLEKTNMYRFMITRLGFKMTKNEKFGNSFVEEYSCERSMESLIEDIDALYKLTKQEQEYKANEIYAKHKFILEEKAL